MSDVPPDGTIQNSASVELASNRTSLSLERTRMAMDRTLMATVRTCFSLIGFGFTLNEVFKQLEAQPGALRQASPHYFGLALVLLGVLMLSWASSGTDASCARWPGASSGRSTWAWCASSQPAASSGARSFESRRAGVFARLHARP